MSASARIACAREREIADPISELRVGPALAANALGGIRGTRAGERDQLRPPGVVVGQRAPRLGQVAQPVEALALIPRAPALRRLVGAAHPFGDLRRRSALGGHQNHPGAVAESPLGDPRARPHLQHGRSAGAISMRLACAAIFASIVAQHGRRWDSPPIDQAPASGTNLAGRVASRVMSAGAQIVRDAGALVDRVAFERAVESIASTRRVLLWVSAPRPRSANAGYRFQRIGVDAEAPPDVHVHPVAGRRLTPEDVCVAVSHTGSTRETVAAANAATSASATCVAITSFMRSPLAEVADVVPSASSWEVSYRLEAVASRLAHMTVVECSDARGGRARRGAGDALAGSLCRRVDGAPRLTALKTGDGG